MSEAFIRRKSDLRRQLHIIGKTLNSLARSFERIRMDGVAEELYILSGDIEEIKEEWENIQEEELTEGLKEVRGYVGNALSAMANKIDEEED